MTMPTRLVADGGYSALNVASPGVTLVSGQATIYRVIVTTSAAAASSILDSAGITPSAANTILTIPASTAVGTIFTLNWPCQQGLSVVPGSGVTLSVSWSEGELG